MDGNLMTPIEGIFFIIELLMLLMFHPLNGFRQEGE